MPWELPIRRFLLFQAQGILDSPLPWGSQVFGLAPKRAGLVAVGLPDRVVKTLEGACAPSTRVAYSFRWGMFPSWCEGHNSYTSLTSTACDILQFLLEQLDAGTFSSTIRGMVAAIKAQGIVGDYKFIRELW